MKISIKREQNDACIGSAEREKFGTKFKKTYRFLSLAALALVGAVMTGCSSENNIIDEPQQPTNNQPANKDNIVTLTTTVRKAKRFFLVALTVMCAITVQAQVKVCMNYDDFKADKWKPYTDLIEGKEPDTCRVKYDGIIFLATDLLLTNNDLMEHHVLYLIDKEPNAKGKIVMTRINDQFMEQLLRDDPVTFEQYYGRGKKGTRQSAANILPILVKKGLIQDYHHKE
ncbi:MAG: hypothetical protein IKH35_06100 [Prevotella sp.]|nr:hypothetical protein [Prevotella sp.]